MVKRKKVSKRKIKKLPALKRKLPNLSNKSSKSDFDTAYDFATKVYTKFKDIIKSIVLFGSVSKNEQTKKSDLDIVIIIDDATINWDQELIAWYREELQKLTEAQSYGRDLHVNTITLTTFWEEIRAGEPVTINVLRYGQVLIDHGYFEPLRVLLAKGKIKPTPESIFTTLRRAPLHIAKAKTGILATIENVYWSMVDACQAALMASGRIPPSPEHIPDLMNEVFVSNKLIDSKYVSWYKEIYDLAHNVLKGDSRLVKGSEVDKHISRAEELENTLRQITIKLLENSKMLKFELKDK